MAHLTCWEFTELPVEIIDVVERDIQKYDTLKHEITKMVSKYFKL